MLTVARAKEGIDSLGNHSHSCFRLFAFIFVGLAIAMTYIHRERFFEVPQYEEGDSAANALQIHRAKQFRELHGNYSRWQFHHPGPAFFYGYALGEWLLFDATKITPAPRNAHIYSGTSMQLAFYAMAIALIATQARQPLLIASLALVAGTLHLAHVDRIVFSVWPPDVLLMPFLCFIVACASVAVGMRQALPVLALAGGFLVHGHVAQLLFVVPLATISLLFGWCAYARQRPIITSSLFAAVVLLFIFLLPVGLDLLRGHQSNANEIRLHLTYHTDAGQTLWQSVLCYVGAFAGINDPSIFNEPGPAAYDSLRERAWLLAMWMGVLAGAIALNRRPDRGPEQRSEKAFVRSLLWFWLGGSGLTLIWGMRQDGGLTSFNSHFNHTLVHTLAYAFILAASRRLPPLPRWTQLASVVAAIGLFAAVAPYDRSPSTRGGEVAAAMDVLLKADPKPAGAKLITFPNDEWYGAVTLARALQRLGITFYVDPAWRFMFGRDHVFNTHPDAVELSEWHVVKNTGPQSGEQVLNRDCLVRFPEVARINLLPARIDFTSGAMENVRGIGIHQDKEWAWTAGSGAAVRFAAPPASHEVELLIDAGSFVSPLSVNGQRADIYVNGELLGRETFGEDRRRVRFIIPQDVWNRYNPKAIAFGLPDAVSPAAAGMSGDRRLLGLRLYYLTITSRGQ